MSSHPSNPSYIYCGRTFTAQEIDWIRNLIASEPKCNRLKLSRLVCAQLQWLRPDGRPKDMSCRVAMLRMYRDNLIALPPPKTRNGNGRTRPQLTPASNPKDPIALPAGDFGKLSLQPVSTSKLSSLWNELIERYHYLGHKPLPGAQIKYLVFSSQGTLLAALGFGAAAWKVAPRDHFMALAYRKPNHCLTGLLAGHFSNVSVIFTLSLTTPDSLFSPGLSPATLLLVSYLSPLNNYPLIGRNVITINLFF
jgi:hypothetical protein